MAVCLDLKRASYWQRSFVAQHPSLLQASRPLDKGTLRLPLGDENGSARVARRRRLSLAS